MVFKKAVTCVLLFSFVNSLCYAGSYGELVKNNSGSYVFNNVFLGYKNSNLPISEAVDLENKSASGYDQSSFECSTTSWSCPGVPCKENDNLFRTTDTKIGKTIFVNVGSAVLLFLPTIFCGFIHSKESHFDSEGFKNAVENAYKNQKISNILISYNNFVNNVKPEYDSYHKDFINKIDMVYDEAIQKQNDNIKKINTKINVVDNSGYWNNSHYDELPSIDVKSANLKKIKANNFKFSLVSSPNDAIDKINKLKNDYEVYMSNNIANYNSKLDQYKQQLASDASKFELEIRKQPKVNNYNIGCSVNNNIDVNANLNPNATCYIKSIDIKELFPSYKNQDDKIKVSINNDEITITNKTDNYIQLKSISTYYNTKVYNVMDDIFELPPQTYKNLKLKYYINSDIASAASYSNVTSSFANKVNFDFGFAIKYRVVEQNIDKTLYKLYRYNLGKTILENGV